MRALPPALCLAFRLILSIWPALGQGDLEDFSFFRSTSIPVIHGIDTLLQPWTGGVNAVRFSEIDLNGDGVNDLFAFEKHGNRILTFLRQDNRFVYAPQYARQFPELHDWAILKDYNGDGRPDIFTYGLAGMRVFKNTSRNDSLSFSLVTGQLDAYYYNGYVNIFASPNDYPVIEDIDGDGQTDILNFWVLGKYVHFLRNYSDNPETFDFRLENECWGHFAEAADNNRITLFTDCSSKNHDPQETTRHTGSSMLLHDFDGNGLQDLLVGDIDSPHLILLYNHGTATEARMTRQNTAFPAQTPVDLFSMPAPSFVTMPGHGNPSLVVSPSDPSLTKSHDCNSVWQYDYDTLLQQYTLTNTAFLQEEMVDVGSGSRPVLYDYDGDGLADLFIANYGSFDSVTTDNGLPVSHFSSSVSHYRNTGTPDAPVFRLQTADFGNLKAMNLKALHPTFGDFDGDGLTDMLCGMQDGTLMLVPHGRLCGGNDSITKAYHNITCDKFSTPFFFDIDGDGRNDLIIGNRRGTLSYWRNSGTAENPSFEKVTDNLGNVDVRDYEQSYFGYSVPCLLRDSLHGTVLFCGSEQGKIFYYNRIDGHLDGTFRPAGSISEAEDSVCLSCTHTVKDGIRSGVAAAKLCGADFPDLITGNYAGGVCFFKGRTPASRPVNVSTAAKKESELRIYPNPTSGTLRIDLERGDNIAADIYVLDMSGRRLRHAYGTQIDLGDLENGIYIIEINHTSRKKIIKTNL